MSWQETTQAVAKALDLEWEVARDTQPKRSAGCRLVCESPLLGPLVAGVEPIGRRDGIPRRNDGDPSIREAIAVDKKLPKRLNHTF